MLKLDSLTPGQSVTGLDPVAVSAVIAVIPLGPTAVQVIYRLPDGNIRERLLTPADEPTLAVATARRPWAFDGDPVAFQLVCEAKRIDLAFLFDPMTAVHTANVEPLPHQITAVYEAMLPRQPLRFVLADDPGAGKTIMAGLYVRELMLRADARRVLVIAPGSLVEQWRDELREKFGLEFPVHTAQLDESAPGGDAFDTHPCLIARLDQLARSDSLQERACRSGWDLVVFDEAHKLSSHFFGSEEKKTQRYRLAERVGAHTRHLLLMTATPHNGKDEDFQLFLRLLDSDRFYGKGRAGTRPADAADLMRRMVKEELVRFDSTRLFPERKAYTVNYTLSPDEVALYEAVTRYVQKEMDKAAQLMGASKGSVGFALTTLQRRLASSPAAIHKSLERRRDRLTTRLADLRAGKVADLAAVPDDDDELTADEQENLEGALVDQATAARTATELEAELVILRDLERQAGAVVASGRDRKWEELSNLLQTDSLLRDTTTGRRKLIVFTEHRDTLHYLQARIGGLLGDPAAVVTIHGGTPRETRLVIQGNFRSDAAVRVLIATDAAGEGVNLQVAHLMVNYDLPWNPNRLEQRFGRIHRIGQPHPCHLWNLVAKETREGAVYHRLLEKLRIACDALKGRVFDVLGEVFEEKSLKELLTEAIRYNGQPERQQFLLTKIDQALDHKHVVALLDRNALAQETFTPDRLFAVKEQMDRAEARRLQPFFVRSFFLKAFDHLGGSIHRREASRYEITRVPPEVVDRGRRLAGRKPREPEPVLKKYERVTFDRAAVHPTDRPNLTRAALLHPGHPLLLAVSDLLQERHADLLRQGTVFVDPADDGGEPSLLTLLSHDVKAADGTVLSQRVQFVRVMPDGRTTFAGWAPHLDLDPFPEADRPRLAGLLQSPWLADGLEARAVAHAAAHLASEHFAEVAERRVASADKTLRAVHERLTQEIKYQTARWERLSDDLRAGKDVKLPMDNARRAVDEMQSRLNLRSTELKAMKHVMNGTPVLLGAALVVPAGLLRQLRGEGPALSAADLAARQRIEQLAMRAVIAAEEEAGCRVVDVSAAKCGWDVSSYPPAVDGVTPEVRHIEVKGRVAGATDITVTRNEVLYALNQAAKFLLAIVFVNADDSTDGPHYVRRPFDREPDWGTVSVTYSIPALLTKTPRP